MSHSNIISMCITSSSIVISITISIIREHPLGLVGGVADDVQHADALAVEAEVLVYVCIYIYIYIYVYIHTCIDNNNNDKGLY